MSTQILIVVLAVVPFVRQGPALQDTQQPATPQQDTVQQDTVPQDAGQQDVVQPGAMPQFSTTVSLMAGTWLLDEQLSDDPREAMREAMRDAMRSGRPGGGRPPGGGGGRPGGAGGRPGGGGGPGGAGRGRPDPGQAGGPAMGWAASGEL